MKKLLIALVALGFSSAASAFPTITTVNLNANNTVQYVNFSVATGSTFQIDAQGESSFGSGFTADPSMYLFSGLGTAGALVAQDDNGGNTWDAMMQVALAAGDYTLAVSDAGFDSFTEAEARAGSNSDISAGGDVLVTVADIGGFVPAVPEPASLSLMGLGLAGLAAVRRRKLV